MALYGGKRDISLFRHLNWELIGDIISQECVYYKLKLAETKVNIYGESAGAKYYYPGVILSCLVQRSPQEYPDDDFGVQYHQLIDFRFLRDDLLDRAKDFNVDYDQGDYFGANLVPEVGDIILYEKGYYEVDNVNANQYYVGKNPDYPNDPNPLNGEGLEDYGWNTSIICSTHYVPADKLGITQERLF